MSLRVGLQERRRLFRESLALLLQSEPDIDVVDTATDGHELIALCDTHEPDLAMFELDTDEWDAIRLATGLRRRHPGMMTVGLYDDPDRIDIERAKSAGIGTLVSRVEGVPAILDALRRPAPLVGPMNGAPAATHSSDVATEPRPVLSPRELQVLQLVSDGRTAREISDVLAISAKTVENHKQRVFHKLAVQNQAHAVAIAMRRGLLVPGELDPSSRP